MVQKIYITQFTAGRLTQVDLAGHDAVNGEQQLGWLTFGHITSRAVVQGPFNISRLMVARKHEAT